MILVVDDFVWLINYENILVFLGFLVVIKVFKLLLILGSDFNFGNE